MRNQSEIRARIERQKSFAKEIQKFYLELDKAKDNDERKIILAQIKKLKEKFIENISELKELVEPISLTQTLPVAKQMELAPIKSQKKEKIRAEPSLEIEELAIKKLKKKTEKEKIIEKKPGQYVAWANKLFSKQAEVILEKGGFAHLKIDLVKSNLQILPKSYVAIILFSILISFVSSIILFAILLAFGAGAFTQLVWIMIIFPLLTLVFSYLYPSMERKSAESRIDQELPFATIHMAAISGSMIDPTKIFSIIISTGEYPFIKREFIKLINEINVLGKDLVGALRNRASNSPSKKLAELFNGLATTITSGGSLQEFFEKRSQTLLFEYHLEREKYTRSAETFMDIYISVVIAAPMILMLIVMLMKISGFGISLSMNALTMIVVLGVTVINILFLTFLQLRQPSG